MTVAVFLAWCLLGRVRVFTGDESGLPFVLASFMIIFLFLIISLVFVSVTIIVKNL